MAGMRSTKPDLAPLLWGVGITALLLLPLPIETASRRWPALTNDLIDFGHPLAFAWLAHVLFVSLRSRTPRPTPSPFLWVLAGAAGYGAATELVQGLVGRQPSIIDFRNDMLGVAFGLLWHAWHEAIAAGVRFGIASLAALVAGVVVSPLAFTIAAYAHRAVMAPVLWRPDSHLFGHLSRIQPAPYPSLAVREPLADWRGHGHLEIDIENPQPAPHPVVVRVHDLLHDQRHRDRYNRRFSLAPRSRQTLRIPLEEIRTAPAGRQMAMEAIRGIVVFSVANSGAQFHVHEIRLIPQVSSRSGTG